MFRNNKNIQVSGAMGMFGAFLFFTALIVEYRYDLFSPRTGPLQVLNKIHFTLAMIFLLVMLLQYRRVRAGGDGRFARISLTLFPIGWALLIVANVISLLTGNGDNLFYPLGGLTSILFGLLSGIAVARNKKWPHWGRFTLLFQGLYNVLVMVVLTIVLTGDINPNFMTESIYMGFWFLTSLALYQYGVLPDVAEAKARVVG